MNTDVHVFHPFGWRSELRGHSLTTWALRRLWCPVGMSGFPRERINTLGEVSGSRVNDKGGWHSLGYWEFSANLGTTWAGILETKFDNKDKRCFKSWKLFPLSPGQNLVSALISIKTVIFYWYWSSKGSFFVCSLHFDFWMYLRLSLGNGWSLAWSTW